MARTSAKNFKASSKLLKPKAKLSETSKPLPPPVVELPASTGAEADAEPSDEDSEDSEDDGVDEEGMSKLMKLLGNDGLDDIAEQQLSELGLGDSEESEDEDSEKDSEDGEEVAEDGSDASESGWVDEDAEMDGPGSDVAGKLKISNEVAEDEEGSEDEEDADEAVALDEASEVDEDVVPKQKVVINNEVALKRIRETIELGKDMPWSETLAFTSSKSLEVPDADDDLNRELAFYKQALDTANAARSKFAAAKLQFSRPADYFAEMVKSDSHMERIRQRLLDERAGIQKSETAKKQRELKKIGKQVQAEKLKEREKGKKEMNERVKGLKRSKLERGGALDATQDSEAFDVAVEDAIADRPAKRGKQGGKSTISRAKRDAKFGFGGAGTKGRRGKQNTKQSTESFDFRGGMGREAAKRGGRNNGAKSKRPGKSRRQAGRA
ncbi:rRNA processing protein Ebp2 [Rhizoctonia solani AG-3 Rhs1AP]|uniref:rRNA processing protein EBP2 n=2 Tax=Rhizoctonia solani AG-3 TaxID=1086053 RepID=A0A074RTS8_9AGAM|nr:rRNA processing protein Ebp2 [Rhizoctonia solani AG-3 Rhs1AP]KEP50249.1 rRNA processing protein EBP2 [Rhizoctonia solani 123E]